MTSCSLPFGASRGEPERVQTVVQRVTVQFHPNWPYNGRSVIESMARDGVYRSQFETGISNGGLTAFIGGDRWRWESRLFEGRYDDAPTSTRPVYGAWNRRCDPYGAAIRFGSSYLRLRAEVTDRCTLCFPDSVVEPIEVGGPRCLPHLAALADESGLDDLDECIEAHVHGGVRFDADVEAIVLDPSSRRPRSKTAAHPARVSRRVSSRLPRIARRLRHRVPRSAHRRTRTLLGDDLTPDVVGEAARSGDTHRRTSSRCGTA